MKSPTGTPRSAVVRDLVAILLATVTFALLSTWLNVGELLLSVTEPNEHYEVDEIPGVLGGAGNIKLTITDDGRGHAGAATLAGAGLGIVGMRERVEALGGRLDATSAPGGGFVLSALLPMRPRHGATP